MEFDQQSIQKLFFHEKGVLLGASGPTALIELYQGAFT